MRLSALIPLLTVCLVFVAGSVSAQTFREKALDAAKVGDNDVAIENFEKALNSTLKVFKDDHVEVITARLELGEAYRAAGRWDDAIGQLDYVWKRARFDAEQNKRWDGEEGHLAYAAGEKLGRAMQGAARYAEAAVVFATTISDGEKSGRDPDQLLILDALLADTLLLLDRVEDASQAVARARERIQTKYASQPENQVRALSTLVTLYHHHRQHVKAFPIAQEAVDIANKSLPPPSLVTAQALLNLGSVALHADGQLDVAIKSLRGAEETYVKLKGPEAPELMNIQLNLSQAESVKKNYKEAESRGMQALSIARLHYPADSLENAQCLHNLANCYMELRQPGKASDLYATALNIFEKTLGRDHPQAVEAKKMLEAARKSAERGE
ncbi:tetratricopeptide repeat protein [Roseimicrobium gellanilyticum]|nr:tetratricopeptide repeat protein [Roseimicrobium gellanilyticum]